MSDGLPPPVPTPPSIARAVQASAEMAAMHDAVTAVLDLTLKTRTDVERLANEATKHGLGQTSLERRVLVLEKQNETILRYVRLIGLHVGAKLDG